MKCHPKLILGTVQLGMRYGIRPGEYKPPVKQEVASILSDAAAAGIAQDLFGAFADTLQRATKVEINQAAVNAVHAQFQ